VAALGVVPIDDALARRAIPNTYLTYPVLIALKTAQTSGNGCGFYVNAERAMYLVTTRHVLADGLLPFYLRIPHRETVPKPSSNCRHIQRTFRFESGSWWRRTCQPCKRMVTLSCTNPKVLLW
jgi:hypothetical protein